MKTRTVEGTEDTITETAVEETSTVLVPQDSVLLVVRSGILDHSIPVSIAGRELAINQDLKALIPEDKRLDTRFLAAVIDGLEPHLLAVWRKQGATVQSLDTGQIKNTQFALPPREHQSTIASFLDHHTSRVDWLIETKQRLLELLEEKRGAVITDAVTKGLDSSSKLQNTEPEVLPKLPSDWTTAPLKFTSRGVTVGLVHKPSDHYVADGVPALRSLNVEPGSIREEELVYISEEANKELSGSQLHAGDLVAVRSGDPGTTAVIPQHLDGINCIDLLIIRRPTKYRSGFLCYLMNSDLVQRQFELGTEGAAQQHFNVEDAENLILPVPPMDEQAEIEEHLNRATSEIDRLVRKTERGIDLFQEKREALITAAVTGQIDVTDWEPPEDDEPDAEAPAPEAVEA
jgi:type I restriction enzyme S subunit